MGYIIKTNTMTPYGKSYSDCYAKITGISCDLRGSSSIKGISVYVDTYVDKNASDNNQCNICETTITKYTFSNDTEIKELVDQLLGLIYTKIDQETEQIEPVFESGQPLE